MFNPVMRNRVFQENRFLSLHSTVDIVEFCHFRKISLSEMFLVAQNCIKKYLEILNYT